MNASNMPAATQAPVSARSPHRATAQPAVVRGNRRFPVVVLALILVALLAGGAITAVVLRQRYHARDIVAVVNGTVLTRSDFMKSMERAGGAQVLQQMVADELLLQYAREKKLVPAPQDVEKACRQALEQPGFQQKMALEGLTPEDISRNIRINLTRAAVLSQGVTVTEEEVRQFYQRNIDRKNPRALYYSPETVQIAAIVTKTQAEGQKALRELNGGTSFENVARKLSVDASSANGGMVPPIPRGRTASSKVPELEKAVFSLRIGQQMGPVKLVGAWWIIRCLDKKPEVTQPFEKVKEQCHTAAMLRKSLPSRSEKTAADFAAFRKKASVQAFWSQYKPALDIKQ